VNKAELELSEFIWDLRTRHALTDWETVGALAQEISIVKKYALREERHPNNPDRPAELE